MKKLKKIISLVLAAVMVVASGMTVSAGEITVTNNSKHNYEAYQIFEGTEKEADGKMVVTDWGDGIDSDGLLTALREITKVHSC